MKVDRYFAFPLSFMAASVLIYTLICIMMENESVPFCIVSVEGNVKKRNVCFYFKRFSKILITKCGEGFIFPVEAIFPECSFCKYYVPYPGEEVRVRALHVKLVKALGKKKCLKDATYEELISLPGIGVKRASEILSGKEIRNKNLLEILNDYFDLSPSCRIF